MPSSFIQDLGLISILLLIGFILRNRIAILQKLFIPVSIITGLLGLLLGSNGLEIVSFSNEIGSYPGIMIAFLFGSLPFTFDIKKDKSREFKRNTLQIGGASIIILLLQWGIGLFFGLTFLSWLYPEIHSSFGAILATGFFGGHGTAAAIGESFASNLQWEEAQSLAMTSATVGIFSATMGGVIMVQWGIKKKHTSFIKNFNELPNSYKTGLIALKDQKSIGKATFSNIAIDPLLMHLMLVVFVGFAGIFLTNITKPFLSGYTIASFSFAFIVGLLIKALLSKLKLMQYFDPKLMSRICGLFADLIVVFGIASIKTAVVVKFAGPLLLIFILGIVLAIFLFRFMGPKLFSTYWFEKSIFLWGMSLGVTAIGIALLRMVDPEAKSETLPVFALGYIGVTPFEVLCLVFFPILASQGFQWHFTLGCLLGGIILYILIKKFNRTYKVS